MKKSLIIPAIISALLLLGIACKKEGSDINNPYGKPIKINRDTTTSRDSAADPTSIQGLHRDLFSPTCANSGCHDGTFEPDFRTVESSFASLVNVKPIKNDQAGTFNARVLPGNADASILTYRMTVDLGGNSGIMPLALEPGSNYPSVKDKLLNNLKAWINKGAPDSKGNKPGPVNFPPQILGVQALLNGNPVGRGGKYEPMITQPGQNLELWFALADDVLSQENLTGMSINWSTNPDVFDPVNEKPLLKGSTKTLPGLYATLVPYVWYFPFSTAGMQSYDVIWFRITCSDNMNNDYQLPNTNSMFFLKKYFALRIP
ncbi:MAG: hypothetical protein ACK5CL_03135 [Sphingomonadales bacterium]|jgi:hypothetical protein